jgi:hypothetical protein
MSTTNFVEVLKQCEQASGAGSKKIIQEALAKADQIARNLISIAMDPYIVLGVKAFEMPDHFKSEDTSDLAMVFETFEMLASRARTGDAARASVTNMLSQFTKETATYLSRIVDKDLRIGASADTINAVWKENLIPGLGHTLIPTFEVMLADKCEDTADFEDKVSFPCQADWKYDGCLSSSWKISLKDGQSVTIGEFVDQGLEGEVLSYNVGTKKKEWKTITAKIKNSMPERAYEWFRLTLSDGTILPPLTGNHRVWLPELKCWRRVDELDGSEVLLQE